MTDTVDIPKIGAVDKKHLMVAVGVAGSYVGYRYWKSRGTTTPPTVVDPNNTVDAGTGSFDNPAPTTPVDSTVPTAPTTNQEWSQKVVSDLELLNFDPTFIGNTLALYLDRQPLDQSQQNLIRTAWAFDGRPPSGNIPIVPLSPTANKPPVTPPSTKTPVSTPKPKPVSKPITPNQRIYTVKGNDTLSGISLRFYHDANDYMRIYNANKSTIDNTARSHGKPTGPHWIFPGERLIIP